MEDLLEGVLFFFSETGTAGGYWAFQDSQFIIPNTTRYICKKCNLYWDKEINPSAPPVDDYFFSSDSLPELCPLDAHQFELFSEENWSYEGRHILKDGDHLTIYHPGSKDEVWSGVIALQHHPVFTEDANGMWIRADQIGLDRKVWAEYFLKEYPAKLVPSKELKIISY